ncbi:hypothetical protein IG631_05063 [Alternaria alternata]|nr:hypothetical protein IG631_05063 [Alternaria alternata]
MSREGIWPLFSTASMEAGRWAQLHASRHTRVHMKTPSHPLCGDNTACSSVIPCSSILPTGLGVSIPACFGGRRSEVPRYMCTQLYVRQALPGIPCIIALRARSLSSSNIILNPDQPTYFTYACSTGTTPFSSPSTPVASPFRRPILLVSYPFAVRYSLNFTSSWSIVSWPICGSSNTRPAATKARVDATKKGLRPAATSSSPAAFCNASRA